MKRNYLNLGDKVKMKDGKIFTIKSLEFTKFSAKEDIIYYKKKDIIEILES